MASWALTVLDDPSQAIITQSRDMSHTVYLRFRRMASMLVIFKDFNIGDEITPVNNENDVEIKLEEALETW